MELTGTPGTQSGLLVSLVSVIISYSYHLEYSVFAGKADANLGVFIDVTLMHTD